MVFIEVVASDGGHRAIAADNSVSSVKAALAALCIFRTRKKSQCLCVYNISQMQGENMGDDSWLSADNNNKSQ